MRQSRYASVKYIDDKVASLDFGSCFAYEHMHGIEAIKNLFGLKGITDTGIYAKPTKSITCLADDCTADPQASSTLPDSVQNMLLKRAYNKLGIVNKQKLQSLEFDPVVLLRRLPECTVLYVDELGMSCWRYPGSDFATKFMEFAYNPSADKLAEGQPDTSLRAFWDGDDACFTIGAKSVLGSLALIKMFDAIKNGEAGFGLDEKYGGLSIANMKVLSSAEKSDGITDTSKTSLF